jgi:hypothetical protein
VNNIRPDRQTVMFSATFPRSVETLARQALKDPVEIQVGLHSCFWWRWCDGTEVGRVGVGLTPPTGGKCV